MINVTLLASSSAAVSLLSAWQDLQDLGKCAIMAQFSGGGGNLAGTLTLEGSVDDPLVVASPVFVTIANSSVAVTSSASTGYDVATQYRLIRCRWVASSGTGNLVVKIHVKESIVRYS